MPPSLRLAVEQARTPRGEGSSPSLRTPASSSHRPQRSNRGATKASHRKKKKSLYPVADGDEEGVLSPPDTINLEAAKACAGLVPSATEPAVAFTLRRLLHGEYLETASAALRAAPELAVRLLEIAASTSTQLEARVWLLEGLAAFNGSSSRLQPEEEGAAIDASLGVLAEPLAPNELQAAARQLLGTVDPERRKAAYACGSSNPSVPPAPANVLCVRARARGWRCSQARGAMQGARAGGDGRAGGAGTCARCRLASEGRSDLWHSPLVRICTTGTAR